jgi:organic hydroperoxide reductase OsmC/OhrA
MPTIEVAFRSLDGTQASVGSVGSRSVVVDRPAAVAGGQGLGFNGGELLGLAVGGCLCNDLQYAAAFRDIVLGTFGIDVAVTLDDTVTVTAIEVRVSAAGETRTAIEQLLPDAVAKSAIVNAVLAETPVRVEIAS